MRLCCVTIAMLSFGVVAGSSRKPPVFDSQKHVPELPVVSTIKPERTTLERTIEQPAYITAYEETPIVVRIPGFVDKIQCDKGTKVEPNQLLAELRVPEMHVELKQKEELVKQAAAEVTFAEESVKAAEAEENRLKGQYERFAKLGPGSALDKETLEETRLGYTVSKAKHGMAKADVDVKKARRGVAEQNRDYVKTMLEYAEIRAPYKGVVTRRNVHTGHYVQPGTAAPPLFVVARTDRVRVVSEIPEPEAPYIREKMKAVIRVQGLKDQSFSGEITRTSWSLDAKSRTLSVEIDMPSDGVLVPGSYAYVSLRGEFPNRLTIPAATVVNQGDQSYVFLLKDGKAARTPVHLGLRSGNLVEVLRKQVVAEGKTTWEPFGDQEIVLSGNVAALSDGQAVQVTKQ
jgi:HlyD family secretion protein